MFSLRDQKLLSKSEMADRHFRKLRLWDRICLALLALMLISAIWNVFTLVTLLRDSAPDLQLLVNFREGFAARSVLLLAAVTIIAFIYKEWRYGERSVGIVYFVVPWLFLTLVPVMMDELLGRSADQVPSLSVSECAPGTIDGEFILSSDDCDVMETDQLTVRLALANPAENDVTLRDPISQRGDRINWAVQGRGDYTIYFLLEQESLEVCQDQLANNGFSAQSPARGNVGAPFCHEQDGSAWVVVPLSTNFERSPLIDFYRERSE